LIQYGTGLSPYYQQSRLLALKDLAKWSKVRASEGHKVRAKENTEAKMEMAGTTRNSIFANGKKEEREMKANWTKAMLTVAGLALACFWPATTHAQAEVSPDFYAIDNSAPIQQPQMTLAANTQQAPAEFQGNISLPYQVQCSGKKLAAGQYTVAVKTEGQQKTVVLHKDGNEVKLAVRQIAPASKADRSALLVQSAGEKRMLEAVYVASLNAILYLDHDWKLSLLDRIQAAERVPIS
jgi:hypothetical protein